MDRLIIKLNTYTDNLTSEIEQWHFHKGYELIFVFCGKVNIQINDYIHTITAPSVIILNPFEKHKIISADKDYARTVLVLSSDTLEQKIPPQLIAMLKCRPLGFSHGILLEENTLNKITNILAGLEDEHQFHGAFTEDYLLNLVYNVLIIIYRLSQQTINYNEKMMQIQAYIDENYASIESIKEIADAFYISCAHLSRSFKDYSGYTPIDYLKNTRLYHAQYLLLSTSLQIKEISYRTGFSDINNFTKQFKHHFGMSAKAFRNRGTP